MAFTFEPQSCATSMKAQQHWQQRQSSNSDCSKAATATAATVIVTVTPGRAAVQSPPLPAVAL